MVSKDQSIGGVILAICVIIALFYTVTLFYPKWMIDIGWVGGSGAEDGIRFWLIAVPVFIAFIAIMAIGAWIGFTMATTPPPKPIEEITKEMEKTEETVEEKPEEKQATETAEEKKTERKRKS